MRLRLVAILAISNATALASPFEGERIDVNFETFAQVRRHEGDVAGLWRAAESTFKVVFEDRARGGFQGSAFFVSNSGHFVTGLHVIQGCLERGGFLSLAADGVLVRTSRPLPASCPFIGQRGGATAEILATGNCLNVPGRFVGARTRAIGCARAEDYAVVRESERTRTPCLPLRTARTVAGEPAMVVGFPVATRGRRFNADGVHQQFSFGPVGVAPAGRCADLTNPALDARGLRVVPRKGGDLDVTEADMVEGSSGGPGVDAQGRGLGVAIGMDPNVQDETHFCLGASYLLPAAHVRAGAERALGPGADRAFRCDPIF